MAPTLIRRALLAVLMVGTLAVTYIIGTRRDLDNVVPERFRYYGIPVAVSADRYGLDGYVAYAVVAARFVNDKPIDVILSEDLPQPEDIPIENARTGLGLLFVPADDKGDVTFARIAFRLFGTKLKSLYRAYFTLLLLSAGAFIVVFWTDLARLLLGVCVMLASMSLLSAFQSGLLPPHVVTWYDPRIFGVIAVPAVLHLGFSCVDRLRFSMGRLLCAAYQVGMVVLAVHVRFDSLWLVFALAVWVGGTLALRALRRGDTIGAGAVPAREGQLRHVWPLVLLAAALGGFAVWERFTYDPRYYTTNMAHHMLWHNAGLGLALHPILGRPFGFQLTDESMMRRVARYLAEKGDTATLTKVFGRSYSNAKGTPDGVEVTADAFLNGAESDLALYNAVARQVTIETMRAHPIQTAQLFAYYKPRSVLAHLLWFTAFLTYDQPSMDANGYPNRLLRAPGDTRERTIYVSPLPVAGLVVFSLALVLAWPLSWESVAQGLLAAFVLFACSLLPSMVAYPTPFLMGGSIFTLTLLLYVGLASLAALSRRGVALLRPGMAGDLKSSPL